MSFEARERIGKENLAHVMANNCTDPDCELHHPEVGVEEGPVTKTDVAFYIAGYFAGIEYLISELDGLPDNSVDELMNRGLIPKPEGSNDG